MAIFVKDIGFHVSLLILPYRIPYLRRFGFRADYRTMVFGSWYGGLKNTNMKIIFTRKQNWASCLGYENLSHFTSKNVFVNIN